MILHAAFTKRCCGARCSLGPLLGRRHGEQTTCICRVCRASQERMEKEGKSILLDEGSDREECKPSILQILLTRSIIHEQLYHTVYTVKMLKTKNLLTNGSYHFLREKLQCVSVKIDFVINRKIPYLSVNLPILGDVAAAL